MSKDRTVAYCLERIREKEAEIQAWAQVEVRGPLGDGLLRGVPFGVKDIFDVEGTRTEFGTSVFAGRVSKEDCSLVRRLRELGGTVVGKTHTTAFAYFDSAPTRNPRNVKHTPGGSSSGSAAAVAAGMVPFALGSQTQGSVLRPASFCGVVGFKPTLGLLPLEGVMPFAPTLDTAGFFAETPQDMRRLWQCLGGGGGTGLRRMAAFPAVAEVEAPMRSAFEAAIERIDAKVVDPPDSFRELYVAVRNIQDYEGARSHQEAYWRHRERVGVKMAQLVERGLGMPLEQYEASMEHLQRARLEMDQVFSQFDVILTPAALGPAPEGFATTGDPRMNAPWTGLGTPAISIPMPVSEGLPLGLQMTAGRGRDSFLVDVACIVER